jgi:hypothetical protein
MLKLENELWYSTKPKMAPDISEEDLQAMCKQIKPLKKFDGFYREIIGIEDLRGIAFTWSPTLGDDEMIFSKMNTLRIMTFHRYGVPSLFKPSIAEVMASIRRFVPDWSKVRYFCLIGTDSIGPEHIIGDCHWCFCELMGEKEEWKDCENGWKQRVK